MRSPRPPRLTGVVATSQAWSGKGAVCGCSAMCLIACCVILFALVAKCVVFVRPCRCSCAIIADDCKCADFASIIWLMRLNCACGSGAKSLIAFQLSSILLRILLWKDLTKFEFPIGVPSSLVPVVISGL